MSPRRAPNPDAQRQTERVNRYGQKPPVGDSLDGVVSVFPAEADEIAAATRCVKRYALGAVERTDLLEALGLIAMRPRKSPKARTAAEVPLADDPGAGKTAVEVPA